MDVGPQNLRNLTEGIHSKEALELVREHLMSVMGPSTLQQFSNATLKMSKFQMVQVCIRAESCGGCRCVMGQSASGGG